MHMDAFCAQFMGLLHSEFNRSGLVSEMFEQMGGEVNLSRNTEILEQEELTRFMSDYLRQSYFDGERVNAETALKIGLAEEVVDTGQSLGRGLELAEMVGRQSPPAVAACKGLIQKARAGDIQSAYEVERGAFVDLFDTGVASRAGYSAVCTIPSGFSGRPGRPAPSSSSAPPSL